MPEAVPRGRLLRRTEAARLLGVSKTTLRRMEGDVLTPVVGPNNVRLFQEEQVQSVTLTRRSAIAPANASGEHAADAFELFDTGVHPADVVKQLKLDPDIVETLHAKWARLRGLLVLTSEDRKQVAELLCGYDLRELKTSADIIAFLEKWVREDCMRQCWQCKNEKACFCESCARKWGLKTARQELGWERARKL